MLWQIVWHLELWRSVPSVKRVSSFTGQFIYLEILPVHRHMKNVHGASKLLGIEYDNVMSQEFGQCLHVA